VVIYSHEVQVFHQCHMHHQKINIARVLASLNLPIINLTFLNPKYLI
jgi:hypothetical protein